MSRPHGTRSDSTTPRALDLQTEWLEPDGLGGFASGTAAGIRTRRYHAWLNVATAPPASRMVLVQGVEAWVEVDGVSHALSSQCYAPDVVHPDGATRIESFDAEPWPRWRYRLANGVRIDQELIVPRGSPLVSVRWSLVAERPGVRLCVRPLLSGRDPHALHHANAAFCFDRCDLGAETLCWKPYPDVPGVVCRSNAEYEHAPVWYRDFLYRAERERGFDHTEDLAAPGILRFDLSARDAHLVLAVEGTPLSDDAIEVFAARLRAAELARRSAFPSRLHRAADAYLVARGSGRTIVAGYPWFGDWGRDSFISLRGLCLATGRLDDARAILVEWAGTVSMGMLPNRFPDRGDEVEFNSADASLWFVVAVHEFFDACARSRWMLERADRNTLRAAVRAILAGYMGGTRFDIHMTEDGLLAAGQPGVQLTWMDAKVGGDVITPRVGKPVEVQALWLNALRIGAGLGLVELAAFEHGLRSFRDRFWNPVRSCLYDVVDADHESGRNDVSLRPNQIFAVGGLPFALLDGERARSVVDVVERELWTPLGLRSLAPSDARYCARYVGGPGERDRAYHQGTAWPWLIGAFAEAWVRVRGDTTAARDRARLRFLEPLLEHIEQAGLGHVSEIVDAEAPHAARGCPFQAWSVGEVLRLELGVLAPNPVESSPPPAPTSAHDTSLAFGR